MVTSPRRHAVAGNVQSVSFSIAAANAGRVQFQTAISTKRRGHWYCPWPVDWEARRAYAAADAEKQAGVGPALEADATLFRG